MARERSTGEVPDLLVVAEVTRAHGIRGEVNARLSGVEGEDLPSLRLKLRTSGGETRAVRVMRARPGPAGWLLAIDRVRDRNAAEALRGAVLLAAREDLPEAAPGEWYVADLVGLRVVDEQEGELGRLEEVMKLPANDVFVVRGSRGEVLIPALEDVILGVEEGEMRVRLPAGLLDPPPPSGEIE